MTHRPARDTWALHFSMPPKKLHWDNLAISGVKRVLLPFWQQQAVPQTLVEMGHRGISVILRVEEPAPERAYIDPHSYYHAAGPATIRETLEVYQQFAPIEAVVVGNEPEHEYDLTRGSVTTWGNTPSNLWPHWAGKAGAHAEAVGRVVNALSGTGVTVVSPGWTHRRITPHDPAEPGRATWARLCTDAYNRCGAGAIHCYTHTFNTLYRDGEDYNRLLWHFGHELERVHTEPWVLEANGLPDSGTPTEHMQGVIRMYEALTNPVHHHGDGLGAFIPFVSSGEPGTAWPRAYLMEDPLAYELLGGWLSTH